MFPVGGTHFVRRATESLLISVRQQTISLELELVPLAGPGRVEPRVREAMRVALDSTIPLEFETALKHPFHVNWITHADIFQKSCINILSIQKLFVSLQYNQKHIKS